MKPCYGLTGGIGSGKSTVEKIFAQLGARIVDTDLISRQLTVAHGAAIPDITKTFGSDYLDASGAMNRTKMRELIFADAKAKKRLESILHPLILTQAKALASSPTQAPYTLVVVPLLFESRNYKDWLSSVIVVDCTEQQQIERTMHRSGLTRPAVQAIMAEQISRTERLRLADWVVFNDGELSALTKQIEKLHSQLI